MLAVNPIPGTQKSSALPLDMMGGRGSPEVVCWASDHWVAGSNPLRGMFYH